MLTGAKHCPLMKKFNSMTTKHNTGVNSKRSDGKQVLRGQTKPAHWTTDKKLTFNQRVIKHVDKDFWRNVTKYILYEEGELEIHVLCS